MGVVHKVDDAALVQIAVQTLLLEHSDVAEASLVLEEGADGRSYTIAYVVPRADRMTSATTSQAHDTVKRIGQWKRAFDRVYGFDGDGLAPTFIGWTSSYTNKPLPEGEMREWLDSTLDRISSLQPDKVLEIGCGVGLLVQALAPRCRSYRATDLSPVAVGRLRDFIAANADLGHVELLERAAIDFSGDVPGEIDTVIINSVVQYFPSLDYLRTVIQHAARLVVPGGSIFIGDVRHLDSLWPFHSAVQLAKASPGESARWLKRKITLAVEQERELLVAPVFFRDLIHTVPMVSQVEVLPKTGSAINELTRYRYDVVLHIGEAEPIASECAAECRDEWHPMRAASPETARCIDDKGGEAGAFQDDIAAMHRLWSADDYELIGTIRAEAATEVGQIADMTACRPIASAKEHSRRLATSPMEAAYRERLGLELSDLLSERLPGPGGPAVVLVVSELPRDAARLTPTAINSSSSGADRPAGLRQMAAN